MEPTLESAKDAQSQEFESSEGGMTAELSSMGTNSLPGDAMQMKQQEAANNSSQVKQLMAYQDMANHATASGTIQRTPDQEVVQRQVQADTVKSLLIKVGRFDFGSDLKNAMPVASGQHRCHTISYGIISNGVKDPINQALHGGDPAWVDKMLKGLLVSIFPYGGTSGVYASDGTLKGIAAKYHGIAAGAISNIASLLSKSSPNLGQLENEANTLISALNNSPDNLRPGLGSTNSSIQEALDLTKDRDETLAIGTKITVDGTNITAIKSPMDVIRINGLQEDQVRTLLTSTYSDSAQIHLFSSGTDIQSSDHPSSMTSGSMSKSNPTPIAIPWAPNTLRLFQTS